MTFQFKVLEGMTSGTTDKDKVPEAIKNNTNKIEDSLLLNKYTKTYEDTIIDLDAHMDMYILEQILQHSESISADPGSNESQQIITKINNAKMFSDSLNHGIKVLDKK